MSLRRRGFTLIELLVVVAIIALLIAILLPSLGKARETTKETKCKVFLRNMYLGMSFYQSEWSGEVMPCDRNGPSHDNKWYHASLMGSTYGKTTSSAGNGFKNSEGWFTKTIRCPSAEAGPVDMNYKDGGEPDNNTIVTVSTPAGQQNISATDVYQGTYSYNHNFGGKTGTPLYTKFHAIRKETLVALDSAGGPLKGGATYHFSSVSQLLDIPTTTVLKDELGFVPIAGTPHQKGKMGNMLFIDGQIITDAPSKLVNNATYGWIVKFRDDRIGAFPFK